MTLNTGQHLQQRYHITSQIGQGGMGAVYQAQDTRLGNRLVAVKEFDPAQLPPSDRQIALQAFQQEAAILARLRHPGLTAVTDYFPENNKFYLVMEFVEGETLQQAWERVGRPFNERQVIAWVQELCDVLSYLHSQQPPIIFRDLKPGNIMLQPNGSLKLIDFGIARHFTPGKTSDTVKFGTPGYAAPEQYGQRQTDARSDVYALGVVTHQLLTGYDPAATPFHLPDITSFSVIVSPSTVVAVKQAIQMDPSRRFSTANEYSEALRISISMPSYPNKRRFRGILAFLLLISIVAIITFITFLTNNRVPPEQSPAPPPPATFILIISMSLLVLLFTVMIQFFQNRKPPIKNLSSNNNTESLKSTQPPSPGINPGTRIIKDPGVISHAKKNKKVIEELILQEDFERLKSFITDSEGGRFLLTGYGHFGGTSLIQGALNKARRELENRQTENVALLVFHFNVKKNLSNGSNFEIVANELLLGSVTSLTTKQVGELEKQADVVDYHESSMPPSYHFDLINSKNSGFFKRVRPH